MTQPKLTSFLWINTDTMEKVEESEVLQSTNAIHHNIK